MYFKFNRNFSASIKRLSAKASFSPQSEASGLRFNAADGVEFVGDGIRATGGFQKERDSTGVKRLLAWGDKLGICVGDKMYLRSQGAESLFLINCVFDGEAVAAYEPHTRMGVVSHGSGYVCLSENDDDSTDGQITFSAVAAGAYRLWGAWRHRLYFTDIGEYEWYVNDKANQNYIDFPSDVRSIVGADNGAYVFTDSELYFVAADADFSKISLTTVCRDFGKIVGNGALFGGKLFFATAEGVCSLGLSDKKPTLLLPAKSLLLGSISTANFGVYGGKAFVSLNGNSIVSFGSDGKLVGVWQLAHGSFVAANCGVFALTESGVMSLMKSVGVGCWQSAPCDMSAPRLKTAIGLEICSPSGATVTVTSDEGSHTAKVAGDPCFQFVPFSLRGKSFSVKIVGQNLQVEHLRLVAATTKEA